MTTACHQPERTDAAGIVAVVVACLALFADMLVYGLAIPFLPLRPSVVTVGPLISGAGTAQFGFGATLAGLAVLGAAGGSLTLLRLPSGRATG